MPPRRRVVKKKVDTEPVNEPDCVAAATPPSGEFTLKTTVGLFRQIADAISPILRDTNIFQSDEGLYIQGMDPGHVSCFESRLTPSLFEEYHAPFSGRIGVNIQNLILILSTAPNTDILALTIESDKSDTLDIAIENDTGTNTQFGLRLMDLDDELMELPPLSAPLVMNFDRKYLQDLFGKFSKLRAEDITIRREEAGLVDWSATTDITTIRSILAKNMDERSGELTEMEQELMPMRIIHEAGAFNLTQSMRQLDMFSKGMNSAKNVKVYVAADSPLTFDIALSRPGMDEDVGFIRQQLAPKMTT